MSETDKPISIVAPDNALEEGTGRCPLCDPEDDEQQIFKCDCGHWACEGHLYTTIEDSRAWTGCDNCEMPT